MSNDKNHTLLRTITLNGKRLQSDPASQNTKKPGHYKPQYSQKYQQPLLNIWTKRQAPPLFKSSLTLFMFSMAMKETIWRT